MCLSLVTMKQKLRWLFFRIVSEIKKYGRGFILSFPFWLVCAKFGVANNMAADLNVSLLSAVEGWAKNARSLDSGKEA